MTREGHEVYYVAFSTAEESVPEGLPRNILEIEVRAATALLGIDAARLIIYKYTVRTLHQHRQQILEEMVRMRRELQPDMVLLPCSHDLHQDHEVVQSKRLMIAAAERRYLLVDHSKFGRPALHFLSELKAFDLVLTGRAPDAEHSAVLDAASVRLRVVEDASDPKNEEEAE